MRIFDVSYLNEVFDYNPNTGVVIWKCRPRTDFTQATRYRTWKNRYEGTEAGTLDPATSKLRVSLSDTSLYLDRLIWKLSTGKDETIYHINGWNIDNRLANLTPEKSRCQPATRYSGGDIYLTFDRYERYVIQDKHGHAFSIHATPKAARTRLFELAETLQCGWENLLP